MTLAHETSSVFPTPSSLIQSLCARGTSTASKAAGVRVQDSSFLRSRAGSTYLCDGNFENAGGVELIAWTLSLGVRICQNTMKIV